jgi:hypothetical protein
VEKLGCLPDELAARSTSYQIAEIEAYYRLQREEDEMERRRREHMGSGA